jgi:flavin reductase (DIM6/NTAB) family NADH-FMN oxidoreductase RutF
VELVLFSLDVFSGGMYDGIAFTKPFGLVERVLLQMSVDPDRLRSTLRRWATGVTVVASEYKGQRHGMTVNSFTSLSLSPPLILVSLEKITRTHLLVQQSQIFGVTILSEGQQKIADRFAGRQSENSDRFKGLEIVTLVTGAPFIAGGLSFLDCRVTSVQEAGTHSIFIAQVVEVLKEPETGGQGQPVIYYKSAYRRLQK